jgi:hypothetical protein
MRLPVTPARLYDIVSGRDEERHVCAAWRFSALFRFAHIS